jgi:hypothetical protein
MNMHIIDDFVKPRIQDDIEKMLMANNFPYYHISESVDTGDANTSKTDENSLIVPQFFHMFVMDGNVSSQYYNSISPISNKLVDTIDTDCYVSRCKVNMNTIDGRFENKYHTPHIDNAFEEQITAIYYANESDGDTFFFDRAGNITERITPKKGRLVWWKGRIFHAKSSPTKSLNRIVLNFNLLPIGDIK